MNSPDNNTSTMQIRVPPRLTTHIDVVDRATAFNRLESQTRGALVSLDLNCPADLFYGHRKFVVRFSLVFTAQNEGENPRSIAIQDAKVGYFRVDNNIEKLVGSSTGPSLELTGPFKNGKAEINMHQPDNDSNDDFCNVRIVVLLDAYPSNMEVSASLCTLPTTDGISGLNRNFTSAGHTHKARSLNEARLQQLLCWTAGLGHGTLFAAYLDQAPSKLDVEDEFGMTPFSWAALTGQASVIQLALQQGGCISARKRTTRGPAPLEAAARSKDPKIFNFFLRSLISSAGDIPRPEKMDELNRRDIRHEIDLAVRNEQALTIRKLVKLLLDLQDNKHQKEAWLAKEMVQASKKGELCFVQALLSCGAKIDCRIDDMTPLMSAIKSNKTKVAEFLIIQGAADENTLRTAVEMKQHSTIRALLQVGTSMKGDLKKELLELATENKDSTTLMLLKLERFTGGLATSKDLDRNVDELFEATVVEFFAKEDPKFQELKVDDLMRQEPDPLFTLSNGTTFKWFHLPANNMKWAEVLIGKIYHYDPSLAYKVLEPKRWVKIQHEGESGSPHARFMMPACHDFSEAFKDKKKFGNDKKDKHVVLFMPYLHWDEEEAMQKRSEFLAERSKKPPEPLAETSQEESELLTGSSLSAPPCRDHGGDGGSRTELKFAEKMLLEKYLPSDGNGDLNSRHVLHIRRTLDQSLYHNLKDTTIRDSDQTVHRYQKKLNKEKFDEGQDPLEQDPLTAIMVDQLWLWILVGPSGKAEAIVTCFPSRDWSDVGMEASDTATTGPGQKSEKILDQRRTTDVLQITRSYIQQRPSAVKTPYDLAGVIASRCSRALLDHSTDMLNFAEVYENSISYIMNEEALLFTTFNTLMQTRTKIMDSFDDKGNNTGESKDKDGSKKGNSYKGLANKLMDDILSLGTILRNDDTESRERGPKVLKDPENHCKRYRRYTLDTEIPDEDEIQQLGEMTGKHKIEHLIKLLEKFGRFYVLDITREITLLRQIKDIQDELEMMEKVFADQKEVLEAMDRIIRIMVQPNFYPDDYVQIGTSDAKPNCRKVSNGRNIEGDDSEERHDFLQECMYDDSDSDGTLGDEHLPATRPRAYSSTELQKQNDPMKQPRSIIWEFRHQKQNLPLRTVLRFSEQIKKMNRRAKNTNLALNTLVDLKQKQNNMIDTRTARLQAEQSHKMTVEAEEQGKTLMVFTIVTIVFLPLSFIAAFFAIPTQEFANNTLTLGFVSKITFPLSAAISLLIIAIGFSASSWRSNRARRRKSVWNYYTA